MAEILFTKPGFWEHFFTGNIAERRLRVNPYEPEIQTEFCYFSWGNLGGRFGYFLFSLPGGEGRGARRGGGVFFLLKIPVGGGSPRKGEGGRWGQGVCLQGIGEGGG